MENTASLEQELSLQHYKEMFIYFSSCFRNQKFEILNSKIFKDIWDDYYDTSLGKITFRLSVNCYLYYIAYREEQDLVDLELIQKAKSFLLDSLSINSLFYQNLQPEQIQLKYLFNFLQNQEFFQDETYKTLILPATIRDYYIFSIVLTSKYTATDLQHSLLSNNDSIDLSYYLEYISDAQKKHDIFINLINCFDKNKKGITNEDLYKHLYNCIHSYFKTQDLIKSKTNIVNYKSNFTEQVLSSIYKKQIMNYINDSFCALEGKNGTKITISNVNILEYQFFTNYVDKSLSKSSLDSALFNVLIVLIQFLSRRTLITKKKRDVINSKVFFDYLKINQFDFLIGSPDLVRPNDYKNQELIEIYENNFKHLYTLGFFREILAFNKKSISVWIDNLNINFSIPDIKDVEDYFEKSDEGYIKKTNGILFSKNELLEYINNTYRNISITGNIHVTFVNKPVGILINPK